MPAVRGTSVVLPQSVTRDSERLFPVPDSRLNSATEFAYTTIGKERRNETVYCRDQHVFSYCNGRCRMGGHHGRRESFHDGTGGVTRYPAKKCHNRIYSEGHRRTKSQLHRL